MEYLVSVGVLSGSFFCLVSALGCLRMKDSYARMHAATKSVAFGGSALVVSYVLAQFNATNLVVGALVISFFYMTMPLAGHFLGRAIYRRGIQPQRPFVVDEAENHLPRHPVKTD